MLPGPTDPHFKHLLNLTSHVTGSLPMDKVEPYELMIGRGNDDDKLRLARLCAKAGIPVPSLGQRVADSALTDSIDYVTTNVLHATRRAVDT